MSFRNNLFVSSALAFVSLCGASPIVSAADTKPIVRETCTQPAAVAVRTAGHPGKSILLPVREVREAVQCARAERKPLILASYTEARGGKALLRGRTERAIAQISARKSMSSSAFDLNNLCVAHTVLRQWSQAGDACDAAVASALDQRKSASQRFGAPRNLIDRAVGVAYSNRAVMHWQSNDAAAAHDDLAKARYFAPKAAYVMRNLEVTEQGPSLASSLEEYAQVR